MPAIYIIEVFCNNKQMKNYVETLKLCLRKYEINIVKNEKDADLIYSPEYSNFAEQSKEHGSISIISHKSNRRLYRLAECLLRSRSAYFSYPIYINQYYGRSITLNSVLCDHLFFADNKESVLSFCKNIKPFADVTAKHIAKFLNV